MKSKKRLSMLFFMLLASVMVFTACGSDSNNGDDTGVDFNKEGLPIVDEDTELVLDIAGRYSDANDSASWDDKELFKELEEMTGIKVNWELTPEQGWTEKRNLLLNSGNLPDVFLGLSTSDIPKHGSQGTLIPLEDLIEEYAPNLTAIFEKHPEVKRQVTAPDGHIYSLPLGAWHEPEGAVRLWINKSWLDEAGLELPETADEFKEALRAFKELDVNGNGDPDDELPYLHLYFEGSENYVNGICQAFGVSSPDPLVINGEVIYPMAEDGYKTCINFYAELYDEGLINQDAFTITWDEYLARVARDEISTVGTIYGYSPATTVQNESYRDEYVAVPPLKGPNNEEIIPASQKVVSQGAFAITSANEHPEATIRWIDQVYDPEMSLKFSEGPNRLEKLEDGTYDLIPNPEDKTVIQWRYQESPANYFVYFVDQEMKDSINLSDAGETDHLEWLDYHEKYREGKEDEVAYPPVMFTDEEADKISRYETDIMTYTNKMTAEWTVNGGISEEDWEDYLSTLHDMGLEDMIEVYQEAYDNYMDN